MLTVYILLADGRPTVARCSTQDAATVEAAVSQSTGSPYRVGFSNEGFPSRWHGKVFIQAWLIATTCLAMPNTRVQRKAACEVAGMAAYVWWFDAVRVCFRARVLPFPSPISVCCAALCSAAQRARCSAPLPPLRPQQRSALKPNVRARGHSDLASCTHLVLTRLCMFTPPPPQPLHPRPLPGV